MTNNQNRTPLLPWGQRDSRQTRSRAALTNHTSLSWVLARPPHPEQQTPVFFLFLCQIPHKFPFAGSTSAMFPLNFQADSICQCHCLELECVTLLQRSHLFIRSRAFQDKVLGWITLGRFFLRL